MDTTFIDHLKKIVKDQIPFDSHAADKFLLVYKAKFGKDGAESFYEEQSNLFSNIVKESDSLKKCSGFSLFNAFISIAVNGLSLEKNSSTQCYLEPRSVKIGKDSYGKDIREIQAALKISGYGELLIRKRVGQITDINNPIIVYDCDSFSYGERDGKVFVDYAKTFPRREGAKIIAGYVKITRPNNSTDYKVMDMEDVRRLMTYSSKNNKRWDDHAGRYVDGNPNALYGNSPDGSAIDSGFFAAKIIKHAFKTFPRISVGEGAVMQADDDETAMPEIKEEPKPFGEEPKVEGTKIDTTDEDDGPF